MAELSKITGTPKATPIKRLGIRRIVPTSAPRSALCASTTPNTKTDNSIQKLSEKQSRLGSYSVPSKKIAVNKNLDTVDCKDSTPISRKKGTVMHRVEKKCRIVVKKLNLADSPDVEYSAKIVPTSNDETAVSPNESLVEKIIQLQRDNDVLKSDIESLQKHESDVNRLKQGISKWNVGAKEALKLLKSKLQPTQSATAILNHYSIPLEIFSEIIMEDE